MPPKGFRKVKDLYRCEQCDYETNRHSYLVDHSRVHSGERPFTCEHCGKGFTQKSNLGQHLKVHGEGKHDEFKCDKCDFVTKWKSSLLIHERWHSGEKPYCCKICGKTFSQSTHCRTHMRESHMEVRKFQCDKCSKCFKRQDHLKRHQLFHDMVKNFECDICGKKFHDQSGMRQHRRIHLGEAGKSFKCEDCPYKTFFKQCLQVHQRIHTGVRPYKCKDCEKDFRTSSSMKLHCRMVHQGLAGKIFRCDQCTFSTANKQSLKLHHMRIHLGIKERFHIRCQYCNKTYMTKGSYYNHRRKRHGETWHRDSKALSYKNRKPGDLATAIKNKLESLNNRSENKSHVSPSKAKYPIKVLSPTDKQWASKRKPPSKHQPLKIKLNLKKSPKAKAKQEKVSPKKNASPPILSKLDNGLEQSYDVFIKKEPTDDKEVTNGVIGSLIIPSPTENITAISFDSLKKSTSPSKATRKTAVKPKKGKTSSPKMAVVASCKKSTAKPSQAKKSPKKDNLVILGNKIPVVVVTENAITGHEEIFNSPKKSRSVRKSSQGSKSSKKTPVEVDNTRFVCHVNENMQLVIKQEPMDQDEGSRGGSIGFAGGLGVVSVAGGMAMKDLSLTTQGVTKPEPVDPESNKQPISSDENSNVIDIKVETDDCINNGNNKKESAPLVISPIPQASDDNGVLDREYSSLRELAASYLK